VRGDAKISLAAMKKPGFTLDWKLNLNTAATGDHLLSPPLLIDFYIGYRGFRSLAFVGSGSNGVAAIDSDLGRIEWSKNLQTSAATRGTSGPCTDEVARIARPVNVAYPPLSMSFRGFGRGTPARSAVGEPGEGAVTVKPALARLSTVPPVSPKPTPQPAAARRAAPENNPFAPRVQYVYVLTSDGKVHSLYVSNGEEPNAAVPFISSGANTSVMTVVDNVAYVSTSNGCGGVENGVWSVDLRSGKTAHWKSEASSTTGPAFGPDGTIYVASGRELVALQERTLAPKGSFKLGGGEFRSHPVVFEWKGKDLIAAPSTDGRLHLLNTASLNTALASTPAFSATAAVASWQDARGERWVLAPAGPEVSKAGLATGNGPVRNGAVVAWKVVEQDGAAKLQPGWVSRDLTSPVTPIIVGDVIFALSGGEKGSNAVLYALDSATGKEVWSSGDMIKGFVPQGGLSAGGSRVYVSTQDGTQYAFGFPIEH
jgi:outer membrane protein assembly factor BamB